MDDARRQQEALFRHAVLGDLLHRRLRRGELRQGLAQLAAKPWTDLRGRDRAMASKTLEEWYYRWKRLGFEGLLPQTRSDRGRTKALSDELRELVVSMKREDPGRSAALILHELQLAGRIRRGQVSASTIRRLLAAEGLSGPKLELERPARLRWQASTAGELWQTDALHGPKLFDPAQGREVRVKIFALLDDRSRLVAYLRADFHETQAAYLTVLAGAVLRRGLPRAILADNHKSFTGSDVQVAMAKLGIRQVFARPYDGPAKGKVERFWRTLRAHVLDRLDMNKVTTLNDLNLRLSAWVEGEYNRRPHAGLSGRTPLSVFEEDADAIRWIDDPATVEAALTTTIDRLAKNDATVQVKGKTYEVPPHLRGRTVKIGYSLLHPSRLWVIDGATHVPLREVDAEGNARRRRDRSGQASEPPGKPTGLNAVEDLLKRITRPVDRKDDHDAA